MDSHRRKITQEEVKKIREENKEAEEEIMNELRNEYLRLMYRYVVKLEDSLKEKRQTGIKLQQTINNFTN